jgi:hypothetical protein
VCLNGIRESQKGSESEIAKVVGENNVYSILYAKGIRYHAFVPQKQAVNGKFYK